MNLPPDQREMVTVNIAVLVQIIRSADGFCPTCARDLAEQLATHVPDVDWVQLVDPDTLVEHQPAPTARK